MKHEKVNREPDCLSCPIPQELRWPQNRNGEADESVIRFLEFYDTISSPSYINRGLQEFAFNISWGPVLSTDVELIDLGLRVADRIELESQMVQNKTANGQIVVKQDIYG